MGNSSFKEIITKSIGSSDQLEDILTKPLRGPLNHYICDEFDVYNFYVTTGGVLEITLVIIVGLET